MWVAVSVPFWERDLVPKKGPPRGPEAKVVYFRGHFLGPFFGTRNESKLGRSIACCSTWSVEAFWRQVCYIRRKFATKKLVFLNLDETSIGYSLMPQAGCVTAEHGRQVPFTAKVKKENHRGCFTYVAIICTCTSLQGKLPHYLLGSRARLTKAVMRGQAALPQTNLKVLAQQSAWNSSPCMVQILEEVAAVIKSVCSAGTQGVLLLDCAPCHLTPSVLKAAAVSGLQLAFVPASATHVAQALDVAAFSGFKKWLQKEHRSLRSTSPDGLINPLAWVWHVMQAPRSFFAAKPWKAAFAGVGAAPQQEMSSLNASIRQLMGNPSSLPDDSKPKPAELACMWPKKRCMKHMQKLLQIDFQWKQAKVMHYEGPQSSHPKCQAFRVPFLVPNSDMFLPVAHRRMREWGLQNVGKLFCIVAVLLDAAVRS